MLPRKPISACCGREWGKQFSSLHWVFFQGWILWLLYLHKFFKLATCLLSGRAPKINRCRKFISLLPLCSLSSGSCSGLEGAGILTQTGCDSTRTLTGQCSGLSLPLVLIYVSTLEFVRDSKPLDVLTCLVCTVLRPGTLVHLHATVTWNMNSWGLWPTYSPPWVTLNHSGPWRKVDNDNTTLSQAQKGKILATTTSGCLSLPSSSGAYWRADFLAYDNPGWREKLDDSVWDWSLAYHRKYKHVSRKQLSIVLVLYFPTEVRTQKLL